MTTTDIFRNRAFRSISYGSLSLASALLMALASACGGGGSHNQRTIELTVENPDRCDPLDPRHCLLPFPSDTFTVEDPSTDTGIRVNIASESAVTNQAGSHLDTTEWNRNDGFSPGTAITTYVAGIDLEQSGIAPLTDIGSSLNADAPIVLIDADSGERWPYWAELDATASSDANRVLLIRPAKNFLEGHRYAIALRNLKNAAGETIPAGDVFRAYRDNLKSNVPEVEARRARYSQVLDELETAGVDRDENLFLAWDFTIASERNLSERLLHMCDDAFARLGSASPTFTVNNVEEDVDEFIARRITGTFDVPLYMTGNGEPGTRLNYGADGLPALNGTLHPPFTCIVPRAAVAGEGGSAVPARPSLYGHGLLGGDDEVSAGNVRRMANEHNFVFCATKWYGMSEDDIGNAVAILGDLSRFPTLADRLQQGVLDTLFLGRLMIHEGGLSSHSAFQANGASVIDRTELYYDGNSQGGIMGGIATAVSIDWTRAVLGVTGMNYSTLLQRSVDWDAYRAFYDPAYTDEIERQLGLILIQMLWDRGEANGYAHHLTDDPLPNTPAHTVLMHVAFGDHQVSMDAAKVQARTIGARIHEPSVAEGRLSHFVEPDWGIEPIPSYPFDGSAIVVWDSGAPAPPTVNLAPRDGEDPHGDPRSDPDARVQKSEFLRPDGAVVDVCNSLPCTADPS